MIKSWSLFGCLKLNPISSKFVLHIRFAALSIFSWRCLLLLGIIFPAQMTLGQEIIWGFGNYTSYQKGTLPIIISVPHGGYDNPASIPDRTCPGSVLVRDAFTLELSELINEVFLETTGCVPYMIKCHISRRKVDCNRNKSEGTCNNSLATTIYDDYHNFIKQAQQQALIDFGQDLFFIDLHGHGHTIQRIELGYLLFADELNRTDAFLDSDAAIKESSIQSLVYRNALQFGHAALLRGVNSLGTLLGNNGYPSVPSIQIPSPGNNPYFSGGFITANYTSYARDNDIPGVQIELNFEGVRDTPQNRKLFAQNFAATLLEYLNIHFGWEKESCLSTSVAPRSPVEDVFKIYPVPVTKGSNLTIDYTNAYSNDQWVNVQIITAQGYPIYIENIKLPFELPTLQLPSGHYVITIQSATTFQRLPFIILN